MYVYPVLHFHVWIFLFKYCNLPFYWRKLFLCTCTGWVYNMSYCIFFIYYFSLYTYISSKYLKKKKVSLNWIVYRVSMYTYILLIKFYFCNFFFRIQPNLETRKKQLEAWCALVLDYHRQNKSYSVDVTEIQSAPLFCNKKLDRILQTWWNKVK